MSEDTTEIEAASEETVAPTALQIFSDSLQERFSEQSVKATLALREVTLEVPREHLLELITAPTVKLNGKLITRQAVVLVVVLLLANHVKRSGRVSVLLLSII